MSNLWTTCPMCGAAAEPDSNACATCGEPQSIVNDGAPRTESAASSARFANRFILCSVLLYIPYFFLPVAKYESSYIYGYEAILLIIVFPPLWYFAAGHIALWLGMVALKAGRWRPAMWCATAAILLSVPFQPEAGTFPPLGWCAKVASIAMLLWAAVIGGRRFGALELRSDRKKIAVLLGIVVLLFLVVQLEAIIQRNRPVITRDKPMPGKTVWTKTEDRIHPGIPRQSVKSQPKQKPFDESKP